MSLLSPFNVSLSTVQLLGQASQTAFGGPVPAGWSVFRTFDNPFTGASATVLQNGASYILAFRGTDGANDVAAYPLLATGDYIHLFDSLLNSLPFGAKYYVTGASLGGGATNLLADIASTDYGGKFANATFVAFASPNISNANGIVNIGFENDPVYKTIEFYGNQPSSLDNLVLATPEYMAGNYNGLLPYDDYAHNSSLGFSALDRLAQSAFYSEMQPDSLVIFAATSGKVQDITPGRALTGAFYLGQSTADFVVGRSGNDFIEGFGGDDILWGGAGADKIRGGAGNDTLMGQAGKDLLTGESGLDRVVYAALSDSGVTFATRDVINTFAHGDKIDLFAIDANPTLAGNQAFTWATALTGAAGQLVVTKTSDTATVDGYLVQADVNGDKVADFALQIYGAPILDTVKASDFIL
jgi:Ca2+-binding RTX toxin-like protein